MSWGMGNVGSGAAGAGIPKYTYTGVSTVVDEGNKNFKIRFLTSGILNFSSLGGLKSGIDIFVVGGGAGGIAPSSSTAWAGTPGGGGGYTNTVRGVSILPGTNYQVVVGDGGAVGANGGASQFSSFASASGGLSQGSGGSGGGHEANNRYAGKGGSDGSNGYDYGNAPGGGNLSTAKIGQHSTTREFGEPTGQLYSGGGGGGVGASNTEAYRGYGGTGGGGNGAVGNTIRSTPGEINTGGGGGGGGSWDGNQKYGHPPSAGGSGIVIIRNTRLI